MMAVLDALLLFGACLMAVPVMVLLLQTKLAGRMPFLPEASHVSGNTSHRSAAVLIPAHNEQEVIGPTVAHIKSQLGASDRLIVVADNCTDDTAAVARSAGAEVIERTHAVLRGKGYALAYGLDWIRQSPRDCLVVIDADCQVLPGSIQHLADLSVQTGRPVQALDLMLAPENGSLKQRVAQWAWRIKNWLRPLAWRRLGGPCQLMGTGMAFPWHMAKDLRLANGHLAEDMMLGVELAMNGTAPVFTTGAMVTSEFPSSDKAQMSQRTRWEHGHISVMLSLGPTLLFKSVLQRNMKLMAMALDLLVPPIALLATLIGLFGLASLMHLFAGGAAGPLIVMIALTFAFTLAVWRAWWGWGRDLVSGRELLGLPLYLLGKLPVYASFMARKQKEWVRTDRR